MPSPDAASPGAEGDRPLRAASASRARGEVHAVPAEIADKVLESSVERKFEGVSAQKLFEAFRTHVWTEGGGLGPSSWTKIAELGDENGEGQVRMVPTGVREEILKIEDGSWIMYTAGSWWFPVVWHRGLVEFVDLDNGGSLLRWSVEYVPKHGVVGVGTVTGLVKMCFPYMLAILDRRLRA